MKSHFVPGLRLTVVCVLLFCGAYTLLVWAIAQLAPRQGRGQTVSSNGRVIGYALVGQKFTDDRYFYSRPSTANYNAMASAGSNKGPSDSSYLKQVQNRLDAFLLHNPGVHREEVPSDLLTASGSGLDPDISVQAAYVQIRRLAAVRHIPPEKLKVLVDAHIEKPFLGFLGPEKVNVLKLNSDLDRMKNE